MQPNTFYCLSVGLKQKTLDILNRSIQVPGLDLRFRALDDDREFDQHAHKKPIPQLLFVDGETSTIKGFSHKMEALGWPTIAVGISRNGNILNISIKHTVDYPQLQFLNDANLDSRVFQTLLHYVNAHAQHRQCKDLLWRSEYKVRQLMMNSQLAMCYFDENSQLLANQAYLDTFEITYDDLLRSIRLQQLIDKNDWPHFAHWLLDDSQSHFADNAVVLTCNRIKSRPFRAEVQVFPAVLNGRKCQLISVTPVDNDKRSISVDAASVPTSAAPSTSPPNHRAPSLPENSTTDSAFMLSGAPTTKPAPKGLALSATEAKGHNETKKPSADDSNQNSRTNNRNTADAFFYSTLKGAIKTNHLTLRRIAFVSTKNDKLGGDIAQIAVERESRIRLEAGLARTTHAKYNREPDVFWQAMLFKLYKRANHKQSALLEIKPSLLNNKTFLRWFNSSAKTFATMAHPPVILLPSPDSVATAHLIALFIQQCERQGLAHAISGFDNSATAIKLLQSHRPRYLMFDYSWLLEVLAHPDNEATLVKFVADMEQQGVKVIMPAHKHPMLKELAKTSAASFYL